MDFLPLEAITSVWIWIHFDLDIQNLIKNIAVQIRFHRYVLIHLGFAVPFVEKKKKIKISVYAGSGLGEDTNDLVMEWEQ